MKSGEVRGRGDCGKTGNMKLYHKRKFKLWERGKKRWLKGLSMAKAIDLEERLLSSSFIWELRKNFFADKPVCLKKLLHKKA